MDSEIIAKYNKITAKIKSLREDIRCTEAALSDRKIDWLTAREYKNDIIEDKRQLLEYERILNELYDYLSIHHMKEEITEITKLNAENKRNSY